MAYWCRQASKDEALAASLRSIIADNQTRLQRLCASADRKRGVALDAMEAIGEKRIIRPDMTITVSAGRQRVVITDEGELPGAYFVVRREPDKMAIREELEQGRPVPGATLSNKTSTLTIRTK